MNTINHSCLAVSLTHYDVICVCGSEIHFCGIPNDSGGEGVAIILKGLIYSLLSFLLGFSKTSLIA